ncbi:MAG: CYTH domain-containing protein [Steroidobacteraceae bacterium]|jgi:adenylate cyclase
MAVEIERKFKVLNDDWRRAVRTSTLLRQGYLANNGRVSVRVRLAGDQGWLSVKAMTRGPARAEYEAAIAAADANEMLLTLCERPLIEKWRYIVPHQGDEWEIDEFLGPNAGLVIAELELDSLQQQFAVPAWLGAEVTHDERYYNFRLTQHPYGRWSENLRAVP